MARAWYRNIYINKKRDKKPAKRGEVGDYIEGKGNGGHDRESETVDGMIEGRSERRPRSGYRKIYIKIAKRKEEVRWKRIARCR